MNIFVCKDPEQLGQKAAEQAAAGLRAAIAEKGSARLILSTGNSQLTTIEALGKQQLDWGCVELFHLDEYIGIPASHPASFRKYLKEKFVSKVGLKAAHFVDSDPACIPAITAELRKAPVDVGLIGIGENTHLAFNDPPADFDTREAYIVVELDEACKKQQVGEGWFASLAEVPTVAISMSVYQILQCKKIISAVPFAVKADALQKTLSEPVSSQVPATMLKTHPDICLYADVDSFAKVEPETINMPDGSKPKVVYL